MAIINVDVLPRNSNNTGDSMTHRAQHGAARLAVALMAVTLAVPRAVAAQSAASDTAGSATERIARQGINAFNKKELESCQKMDQPAAAALWADDGVDLIQGLPPMVGKPVIASWLNGLTSQLTGAKMLSCTIDWRQLTIQGDWAYEWGITRQHILFPPPQKSVESVGKMTLVLKREPGGEWKIALESWNSSPQAPTGR